MSRTEFNSFLDNAEGLLNEVTRYLYFTRSASEQLNYADNFDSLIKNSRELKCNIIEDGDEDTANHLLCVQCKMQSVSNELRMWVELKKGDFNKAWEYLVFAQAMDEAAGAAHCSGADMLEHAKKMSAIEVVLFPPHVFFSTRLLIIRSHCSICGKDLDECEHLVGLPYWGEFCYEVVDEMELITADTVKNPSDKRCRVEKIEIDGQWYDYLRMEKIFHQDNQSNGLA